MTTAVLWFRRDLRLDNNPASGEWTASPMTRAHFEKLAAIFQAPDEEEILLFDKPVAEG